jgi:hypothetical protein
MSPRRYAVFGLLDAPTAAVVRPIQRRLATVTGSDLALRFPVHVTLRGRFWAEPASVAGALRGFDPGREWAAELPFGVPVFRDPDMLWLPVDSGGPGFECLLRLHTLLTAALREVVVREETLPAHTGSGYSPHVTLAWGATRETPSALDPEHRTIVIKATLASVVVAEYPASWPAAGPVIPVASPGPDSVGSWHPPRFGE